jgi:hypothetical protein
MSAKNRRNSWWRWRGRHIDTTAPVFTSSPANKVVVPLRVSSWVIVPARPGIIGRLGCVRLSAWICDFSSTHITIEFGGGSR